ncbi:MAG: insulinase family protein [Oscillospiraceae bacterium]|nr:insulinase family protein [Oscillospiraceae bacterium]
MGGIERKTVLPGVNLSCVYTDKFKNGLFSAYLMRGLNSDDAPKNAMLADVLRRGCTEFPDMESIEARLDELYGASVSTVMRQIGETTAVGFSSFFADDRYLGGTEKILESAVSLTGQLLLDPATKGGMLNSDYVRSERDNLCDRIRAAVNDKRRYAVMRLKELMCADESYGVNPLGSLEKAGKMTHVSLTRHYRHILEHSPLELFYCGGAEPGRVEAAVLDAFAAMPRGETEPCDTEVRIDCGPMRTVNEKMDVSQGNLAIGFRLGEIMYNPNHAAMAVFSAVFGGSPVSKLFLNVRERMSLCYSVGSSLDRHKGIMVVSAGISPSKYDAATEEIFNQLDKCRRGEISEDELAAAKKYVASGLRESADEAALLDSYWLSRRVDGTDCTPEETAALAECVSAEQVIEVAESVKADMIYFLSGEESGQ